MSFIWVNVTGSGTAYVDNPNPINGDVVTLYAYPDTGETIRDVTARESHGYAVAIAPFDPFVYHESWGDLTINVEFSGTTPPTPSLPVWLIVVLKKITERR